MYDPKICTTCGWNKTELFMGYVCDNCEPTGDLLTRETPYIGFLAAPSSPTKDPSASYPCREYVFRDHVHAKSCYPYAAEHMTDIVEVCCAIPIQYWVDEHSTTQHHFVVGPGVAKLCAEHEDYSGLVAVWPRYTDWQQRRRG
jgi:hypothetical protein